MESCHHEFQVWRAEQQEACSGSEDGASEMSGVHADSCPQKRPARARGLQWHFSFIKALQAGGDTGSEGGVPTVAACCSSASPDPTRTLPCPFHERKGRYLDFCAMGVF